MFLVFASPDPRRVAETWRTAPREGRRLAWHTPWSWALAGPDTPIVTAPDGGRVGVGHVRLRRAGDRRDGQAADLAALITAAATAPSEVIGRDGTFALVTMDAAARRLHACRDAFGIRTAYWSADDDGVWIGDDLDDFAPGRRLDRQFAAEFIARGQGDARRTVWQGVQQLPPGGVCTWEAGRVTVAQHQPWREACEVPADDRAAAARFRALVVDAVSADLDDGAGTWADLSGGHDSSSVAAVAGWLARHEGRRFQGGVTIVDSLGHGDESQYADDVARAYALPALRVVDPWPWRDDQEPPPATPAPVRDYPHWARDRHVARELRRRGDGVLLSGVGPDYYLPRSPWYAIDLAGRGRWREALAAVEDTAIETRTTVWHTLWRYVVGPLAPAGLQARWFAGGGLVPGWLTPAFAAETGFARVALARDLVTAWPGQVNDTLLAVRLSEGASILPSWRTLEGLDVRHPLLALPLVRFCLSLPRHLRTSFAAPKPILRQGLAGIVPPRVLARRTKGSVLLPRICWAFGRERARLAALVDRSILAAAGIVDPGRLLAHADTCAAGAGHDAVPLYHALSLESWLSARRDRGAAVSW